MTQQPGPVDQSRGYPPTPPNVPPGYPPAGYQAPAQDLTGRDILRMGLWNYASNRWAPKNKVARFVVEIGILVVFFMVLAIMVKLSQG